ncbi:MAG TPA: carboxypeptidase regulatory-like domain-containing protein, partial [Lachnospiraceae bacterium]|nr:carboxypeptidase regulatory-like domain-containing protein [Lachnospiraceae bacterium]
DDIDLSSIYPEALDQADTYQGNKNIDINNEVPYQATQRDKLYYDNQQNNNQQYSNQQTNNQQYDNQQYDNQQYANQQHNNLQYNNQQQYSNQQFDNQTSFNTLNNQTESQVSSQPKKRKVLVPVIIISAVLVLALAVGAFFLLNPKSKEDKTSSAIADQSEAGLNTDDAEEDTDSQVTDDATDSETDASTDTEVAEEEPVNEEATKFADQIVAMNTGNSVLESIDVYADNYDKATRDTSYQWDNALFYSLEEISPDSEEDGVINSYTIEKKQLINAKTNHTMEYEIYRNPDNDIVNKIVSIEYYDDHLEIVDYYYDDNGKVNFIFVREDINYIPTYANPSISGERFYFNKDVLVKWRIVKDEKQVNYVVGQKEKKRGSNSGSVKVYKDLSSSKQQAYDSKEDRMIDAAYNTYDIVLKAEGFNNIVGYVFDENGEPITDATVKLYSKDYDIWAYEQATNSEGQYSIKLPSLESAYSLKVVKDGFVDTDIYDIRTGNDVVNNNQETVNLVTNADTTYPMTLTLCDAFNQTNDGLVRLDGANVVFRKGINNKLGDVYLSTVADSYGELYADLAPGSYTVEISKDGYATSYYTIVAKSGLEYMQINTSPILNDDEIRIVLTWGSSPADLDSHLFTPYNTSSQDDTYHIWYGNQSDANANSLDVDQTTGYGPETMTINHLGNGLYKYYVVDYTNCSHDYSTSTEMSFSSACVNVYTKDGLVQTFYVPTNRSGAIWEVFELRNKQIVPIQRYYSNIEENTWWNNEK